MSCHFCEGDSRKLPTDRLDQQDMMELVAAIASGNRAAAGTALDMLFRDDGRAREWIALARARARRAA